MQDDRIQDGCHHQVQSEWMTEVSFVLIVGTNLGKCKWVWEEILRFLNARWWNWTWQNSRWLPSSSWVRMNEFESDWISLSQSFVQNGWIQDGRFQHSCHHLVEREWMTLSQIELVWVRVLCKMAESKMAELKMTEFKMAATSIYVRRNEFESDWISLSQSQSGVRVFLSESERR